MAGRFGVATVSAVALAAATTETIQQLISNNIAFKLIELAVSFDGNSNTAVPALVELLRQSTAGTSSANNPVKADDSVADALNTTGLAAFSGAEPTPGDILRKWYVHPQTGLHVQSHDLGPIITGVGDRLAIRITAPATVNATVMMGIEE